MQPAEIISLFLVLLWILSMPYLKRFKVYQFCGLLAMPFMVSYLIHTSIVANEVTKRTAGLFILLLSGFLFQAWKFYKTYLASTNE